ncbi:hypothetical protein A7L55_20010 [Acinetobacter baumannii]|nr:hypothetical protein A7L55_20010 [Acinetobacter baumannii]
MTSRPSLGAALWFAEKRAQRSYETLHFWRTTDSDFSRDASLTVMMLTARAAKCSVRLLKQKPARYEIPVRTAPLSRPQRSWQVNGKKSHPFLSVCPRCQEQV